MKIETVAIIGLGALGILYCFISRKPSERIACASSSTKSGWRAIRNKAFPSTGSPCDFQYVDEKDASLEPADLVILAVKGTQLDDAIETARNQVGQDTTIISVLNGISSEEVIGAAFGGEDRPLRSPRDGHCAPATM